MIKQVFCTFLCALAITSLAYSQVKPKFEQLPAATQSKFKKGALKFRTGAVDYRSVEKQVKVSGIDISNMALEEAVMIMFMLIAEDAQKDLKAMLEEMQEINKKKSALRETISKMKRESDSLRQGMRDSYSQRTRLDSLADDNKIKGNEIKIRQNNNQLQDILLKENKMTKELDAAELHLKAVEKAIKELQTRQAQKSK